MKKKNVVFICIFVISFSILLFSCKINNDKKEETSIIKSIEYYYDNSIEIKYVENDSNNNHYYIYKINGDIQENRPVWLSVNNAKFYNNNLEEVSKEGFVLSNNYIFKIYCEMILMTSPEQINALYVFI